MLVWSKIIASDQENYYEDRFLGMGQTNAVIKQLSSSNRLRVEVFLDNQKEANHLIDEFGGKINKLENIDWAKKNSISNRPLIKIRDQILVQSCFQERLSSPSLCNQPLPLHQSCYLSDWQYTQGIADHPIHK